MSILDTKDIPITIPKTLGGMATLHTQNSVQATFQIDGNGALDFGGGEWVIDVALLTTSHYVQTDLKITKPGAWPLPQPADNYRLRCVKAPVGAPVTIQGLLRTR